jgi:hypothetical protein
MSNKYRVSILWGLVILLLVLFVGLGYTLKPLRDVTGFHGHPLWDWIAVGLVSAAIGLVGWQYSRTQRKQEEADTREREQDAALSKYLDQMSNLMIDRQLGKDRINNRQEEVRKVAQARTIAVLLELDEDHKRRPLKLVYELGLLNKPNPVLELKNAGLDGANLSELTLRDACLNGADLRRANLHGADLEGSNLNMADLRGADLSGVDLTDANFLPYDENNPTRWNKHNLEKRKTLNNGASLSRKILGFIVRNDLKALKELKVTNLSGATLKEAQFCNAWLYGVNLEGADLEGAKGISIEQLDQQAYSLKGATMPNGQMYEDWLKDKGHGYEPPQFLKVLPSKPPRLHVPTDTAPTACISS